MGNTVETTSMQATFVSAEKRIPLPLSDATPQVLSAIFHFQKCTICLIDGTTVIGQSENGVFEGILADRVYTVIGDYDENAGSSGETGKVKESEERQVVALRNAEEAKSLVIARREQAVALFTSFEENFRAGSLIECVQTSLSRRDYKKLRRHVGEKLHVALDALTSIKSAPLSALTLQAIAIAVSRLNDSTFRAELVQLKDFLNVTVPDAFAEAENAVNYINRVLDDTSDDIRDALVAIKKILEGATSQQLPDLRKTIENVKKSLPESSNKCCRCAVRVTETFDTVLEIQNALIEALLLWTGNEEKVISEVTQNVKNLKAMNDFSKKNDGNVEEWLSEIVNIEERIKDALDESYAKKLQDAIDGAGTSDGNEVDLERYFERLEELREKIAQARVAEENAMEERFSRIIEMDGLNFLIAEQHQITDFLISGSTGLGRLQKEWTQLLRFFKSISTVLEDSFAKSSDNLVRKYENVVACLDHEEEDTVDELRDNVQDMLHYTNEVFMMIHEIVSMTRLYAKVSALYVIPVISRISENFTLTAEEAEEKKKKTREQMEDVRQKVHEIVEIERLDRNKQIDNC